MNAGLTFTLAQIQMLLYFCWLCKYSTVCKLASCYLYKVIIIWTCVIFNLLWIPVGSAVHGWSNLQTAHFYFLSEHSVSTFSPMLALFWLLVSQQTGLHCATMFSSVAVKGSQSVDTLAKPGRLWREVAFEWPEITWAWAENTNICYSVQGNLDSLKWKNLVI